MNDSFFRRSFRFGKVWVFAAIVFAGLTSTCFGQATGAPSNRAAKQPEIPKLSYDVVSIRPIGTDASNGVDYSDPLDKAVLDTANTAEDLVGDAFGERYYEVFGAPEWARSTHWVIHARGDEATTEALKKLNSEQARRAKQQMLQQLLKDRFHLQVHSTTKEAQVYKLVVAKKGSKLQKAQGKSEANESSAYGITAVRMGMEELAIQLSMQIGTDVRDETGLTGVYAFKFAFRPWLDTGTSQDLPSIPNALEEQLGLKLVPVKGQKQLIMIDHIEMPTGN